MSARQRSSTSKATDFSSSRVFNITSQSSPLLSAAAAAGDQAAGIPSPTDPPQKQQEQLLTIPTLLTLARLVAVPALIGAWYAPTAHRGLICCAIFIGAALTDWLDGYLARKLNASSEFGAFLDPVVDKLIVSAALIIISTQPLAAGWFAGNAWLLPLISIAIINREITMSAVREWAASKGPEVRSVVAVNNLGKWKTATQMVALVLLLYIQDGGTSIAIQYSATLGPILLAMSAYLSLHSLFVYVAGVWRFMK